MKLPRRQFLHLAAGAAALPAAAHVAWAEAYPTRPVRIIVPAAPSGAFDIMARLIGQRLSERLGQPFVIDNRPGGGTNIGTEAVVRAPADGYTLLIVGSTQATNAALYDKPNFDLIRDIAPIAGVFRGALVMVVHPSVSARSVPEFIAYAKANPRKVNMASSGTGTTSHVAGELFKMMAGIDMVHVPYRGGGPAVTDLLGGQVQVYFASTPASIEYIKAGRLRGLALTTATRRRCRTFGRPKSEAGERTVPLPPMVIAALREHRLASPPNALGLVFTNRRGNVDHRSNIVYLGLHPAQVAAGVVDQYGRAKYKGLHSLRHFYASWSINRRVDRGLELPLKVVQARLGHASIQMTADVYGHLFPRSDDGSELAEAERALLG
jgi:tripartite-type tricarboxylate transporter receptor subunit TctC